MAGHGEALAECGVGGFVATTFERKRAMTKIRWERDNSFYCATFCGVAMHLYYDGGLFDWWCALTPGTWTKGETTKSAAEAKRHVERETLKLLKLAVKAWPKGMSP